MYEVSKSFTDGLLRKSPIPTKYLKSNRMAHLEYGIDFKWLRFENLFKLNRERTVLTVITENLMDSICYESELEKNSEH